MLARTERRNHRDMAAGTSLDAAKREVLADQQWSTVKQEETRAELRQVSHQILELTQQMHASRL
jgi:hypothetical protein